MALVAVSSVPLEAGPTLPKLSFLILRTKFPSEFFKCPGLTVTETLIYHLSKPRQALPSVEPGQVKPRGGSWGLSFSYRAVCSFLVCSARTDPRLHPRERSLVWLRGHLTPVSPHKSQPELASAGVAWTLSLRSPLGIPVCH